MSTSARTRNLVLVGGGHTHALVLEAWAKAPPPNVHVTLLNPDPVAAYSGMLPGFVAGHYPREALEIDLAALAKHAGVEFKQTAATGIDLEGRRIRTQDGAHLPFDVASLDIGITTDLPQLSGFAQHGIRAKPLGPFAAAWADFRARAVTGTKAPQVAVLGGGVAGAELALAMSHALRACPGRQVSLLDRSDLLNELREPTRRALLATLERAGVALLPQSPANLVGPDGVTLESGARVPAAFIVGAAGARPHAWLAQTGLALHAGYVAVDAMLQSSDPAIFACGDCAHLTHAPRPKAGVYAVRQAPVLFDNICASLASPDAARMHKSYTPQKDYLKLISLGDKRAMADKYGLRLEGRLMWRWKDRIDRAFMSKFNRVPDDLPNNLPD